MVNPAGMAADAAGGKVPSLLPPELHVVSRRSASPPVGMTSMAGLDQRWVQVKPPGGDTSITLVTWFDTMPPGSAKGTVVESDDLDADVTAIRSRGVDISDGIQEAPWGRFVTFNDPDGNGIVLQATASRLATPSA